jgi:Ca2+-binding EF-hand superfamily protein
MSDLSKEQVDDLKASFDMFDKDKSGKPQTAVIGEIRKSVVFS